MECAKKGNYVEGLTGVIVQSEEGIMNLLQEGELNRHIGKTGQNQ